MDRYRPPLDDIGFCLETFADLPGLMALPDFAELAPDLIASILEAAGRFAAERLAPLNAVGDRQGSRLENGIVRTPEGFRAAYDAFLEGGWNGVPFSIPSSLSMAMKKRSRSATGSRWRMACNRSQ